MTKTEINGLKVICCFIIKQNLSLDLLIALKRRNKILFLKRLENYKFDDKPVVELAIKKFVNYLWYFDEEIALFSIFDDRIGYESKSQIAKRVLENRQQ